MKIGYVRTSTDDQSERAQREALTAFGCEKIYHDLGVSGNAVLKPQLEAAIAACSESDTLVVTAYDRLARSLKVLLGEVDRLGGAGFEFVSLREQIDTTTPEGKFYFHIVGAFAEFERERFRTRPAARAAGRAPGRPSPIDDARWIKLRRLLDKGSSVAEVAKIAGVRRQTIYRRIEKEKRSTDASQP